MDNVMVSRRFWLSFLVVVAVIAWGFAIASAIIL